MLETVPVDRIKDRDQECRPQVNHIDLSRKLSALYEDRATSLVLDHLCAIGTGNPALRETGRPVMSQVLQRVIDAQAVLYVTPPVRRVLRNTRPLPDDHAISKIVREAFDDSNYDEAWRSADSMRALHKQAVISFDEDPLERAVSLNLYEPCSVFRYCPARPRPTLEHDEWILLQVAGDDGGMPTSRRPDEPRDVFYAWHKRDGVWLCWLCDDAGRLLPEEHQPYGAEGKPPFDGLPVMVMHDRFTNHPWVPVPESRVSYSLAINSLLNDLEYLVYQEAHSIKVLKSDMEQKIAALNPGSVFQVGEDEDLSVLSHSPKIADAIRVLQETIESLAVSESIPIESLTRRQGDVTGDAIVANERDLENRRQEKAPMAVRYEKHGFEKFKMVYNAHAGAWGKFEIPDDVRLSVHVGRQLRAKSPTERQQMLFQEMAAGLITSIDYFMKMYGMSREEARCHFMATQEDRPRFPIADAQPAGALLDRAGPRAALGEGSHTREPGLFHPDQAGASEGASVVSTIRKRMSSD